jgi:adenine-specific DNA-methyltransferase
MAKKRANGGKGKALGNVTDYRHDGATRVNIPPAKIAAEGAIPKVQEAQYSYSPRRPPTLRFDQHGAPDKLFDLLEQARHRALNEEEAKLLADALQTHEPWLEWAGKREAKSFEVDPVALMIHERISTQAILRVAARQDVQRDLFADPQMAYHEAVQFYRHDMDWANRLILGDSLQVMSSLARREDLAGKVQMIYMDPPYGIKFASNFQPEIGKHDVKEKEQDLTREPEMVKAYRDTWTLGVHSYLAYLRDRLLVARELLADTGSLFVQIGEENLHIVRSELDEVFGSGNSVCVIYFRKKTMPLGGKFLERMGDFILWYAKDKSQAELKFRRLYQRMDISADFHWKAQEEETGHRALHEAVVDSGGIPYRLVSMWPPTFSPGAVFCVDCSGTQWLPPGGQCWPTSQEGMRRLSLAERLHPEGNYLRYVLKLSDYDLTKLTPVWIDTIGARDQRYVVQTSEMVVARCLLMTTDPGDLVLDPTCGSGTTAYVAEQWGRRWITIDTSRVALALARQRLMTSRFPYYQFRALGADDLDRNPGGTWLSDPMGQLSGKCTFLCKTVPHITLKSIARNTALDPIFAKHEPILATRLDELNASLKQATPALRQKLADKLRDKQKREGKKAITDADRRRWELPKKAWEHWEVPFDSDPDWPKVLQDAVTEYRQAWRAKMDEVNACIGGNAEQEELFNQPDEVKGVVRVTGPFTVEAVQPPEVSLDEETDGKFDGGPEQIEGTFEAGPRQTEAKNVEAYLDQMIRLLRMDGVRFPDNKQMRFTRLEAIHGGASGLHAEGRWVADGEKDDDAEGRATLCVAFGPQYGPVTAKQVEELVRSANRRGYDGLVVAGFSFDGPAQAVIEEAQHPKLRIHMAHIRPDVNPGMKNLLKEQPGSQLFSVFGLPRTRMDGPTKDGEYTVTMEGVDIYNPVDNSLSATGADKVAAWFLDSDYDGRTFCITQAFFPDRTTWDKLSKALIGVVDPDRFDALSGTVSLPFPLGQHKCVAVKVIDPRGNEVMQVHRLEYEHA